MKKMLGFASKRSIPLLYKTTLRSWQKKNRLNPADGKLVYLFADEFTNYNDVEVGIAAIKALNKLGYRVEIPNHIESGRTFLSKGLLRKAKKIAEKNVTVLAPLISEAHPLIGIEPSAILTFRDEYLDLTRDELNARATELSKHCFLFEDFIMAEAAAGNITKEQFTSEARQIRLHGHCHQKSLASTASTKYMLTLPLNYEVDEIKSGCCGMAGSFGYEAEHYDVSMKVGELVLFPEVRKTDTETTIAAPGTSCRHQIMDGTGRKALHPVEVFWESLL
jgi:Fe-S oxidoreductase